MARRHRLTDKSTAVALNQLLSGGRVSMNTMMGFQAFIIGAVLTISSVSVGIRVTAQELDTWDPEAAAVYLDSRQAWWMEWPTAARDHGTFCVSCHSTVPYALARTVLRTDVPGVVERRLLENIETRVSSWDKVRPFYSDEEYRVPKTSQSRGTEAILNALILANRDARRGSLAWFCAVRESKHGRVHYLAILGFFWSFIPSRTQGTGPFSGLISASG